MQGKNQQLTNVDLKLAEVLSKQIYFISVASLVLSLLLVLALYDKLPTSFLLFWQFAIIIVTCLRFKCGRALHQRYKENRQPAAAYLQLCVLSIAMGLCWGGFCSVCLFMLGVSGAALPLLSALGFVAVASISTSPLLSVFGLFCVSGYLPILLSLYIIGTNESLFLLLLIAVHLTFTWYAARNTYALVTKSINDADALELARSKADALAVHLRDLSRRDATTDLANRRSFDETISDEWRRATRANKPLALLICDLDFFKAYNDSLGHLAGDRCLHAAAQALQQCCKRGGDLVARLGGEEFAVLLPDTNRHGALTIGNRLCKQVEDLSLPHPGSTVSPHVTITIGAAVYENGNYEQISQLIEDADQAMYQGKKRGRNHCVLAQNDLHASIGLVPNLHLSSPYSARGSHPVVKLK